MCPLYCFREAIVKFTQEQIIDKIFKLVGEEYTVLGNYKRMKEEIQMRHNVCGFVYSPIAYEFIKNGTRCPNCAKEKRKLGDDEFRNRVNLITDNEYVVLGSYINNRTKIEMKHLLCGQVFNPNPASFLSGTRCPFCSGRRSNIETFKQELFKSVGNEYQLLGNYINKSTEVDLLHTTCGEIYRVKPVSFLRNMSRCPKCRHRENGIKRRKSNEVFENNLLEKLNGEFIAVEEYQTALTKIKFKHVSCGEIFEAKPNALLIKNASCPKCSGSLPETLIEKYLTDNKIVFQREYRFNDCIGKRKTKLPFDFAIFDKNNKLILLIEYDGQQHYRPSFGEENYKRTLKNDRIKNDYCKANKIPLFRIPYWELNNINNVLEQILFNYFTHNTMGGKHANYF